MRPGTFLKLFLLVRPISSQSFRLSDPYDDDSLYVRDFELYENSEADMLALERRAPIQWDLDFGTRGKLSIDVYGAGVAGCAIAAGVWCIKQIGVNKIRAALRGITIPEIRVALAERAGGERVAEQVELDQHPNQEEARGSRSGTRGNSGSRSGSRSGTRASSPHRARDILIARRALILNEFDDDDSEPFL